MGRRARVELRYFSPGAWIHLFWFLSCFLLLCYLSWWKRKILLVLVFHFDFPANFCFFFLSRLYISWRIRCSVGVSWKGGTPLFGLDGNVPLSGAWFSGSWSGILYKNVKVGYKQSILVIPPTIFDQKIQFGLKITYSCMWNEMNQGPNIWSLFLSRIWVWRPRWQNFTQTFLECTPQVWRFSWN